MIFLAVNGPSSVTAASKALGRHQSVISRQFQGLEKSKICRKWAPQGHSPRGRVYSMALDERHPAFRQIRDLALALHNKFPVPIVTRDKEQPYDPKDVPQTVFHTRVRARTICLIGATREIEITKIAPLLGASAIVEEDVQDLKTIGLVSIRYEGRSAFVSLNRDFFAYAELKALVDRLTSIYPEYQKMVEIYASGKSPQAKRTRKRRKTRKR